MADGFIVRKGGAVTEQAAAPTITEVSVTDSSITFTIKNEDTDKAIIRYRIDDIDAEGEIIELAGGATSSNITASGLDDDTEYIVFATANVTGKVKSNVTQLAIETDPLPVYTAATGGTTEEYDDGGKRYKSHTFTSDDDFEVTTVGDATDDRNKVDFLVIAGGGGGGAGAGAGAGGGGAGGYITSLGTSGAESSAISKITVTETTFGIVIGSGGAGTTSGSASGSSGTNSTFSTVTATGGGGGGGFDTNGLTGGSGGGGGSAEGSFGSGGTGTANQGRNGGDGNDEAIFAGGGGGGAKDAGANGVTGTAGDGGDGLANLLRTGSNETRAGGGGGGVFIAGTGADGGAGGGGQGAIRNVRSATAGTANTGSGGGGGSNNTEVAAAGGDGIVIIRYEIAPSV
jgi:hypothetical protein